MLFAKFLQKLFNEGENHGVNLLNVANSITKGSMPDVTYEYALFIYGSVIDMFTHILYKDEMEFNKMLLLALQNHDKYYKKDDLVFSESTTSLWISAVCVMAKDYDIKIEHTSDYLIQSLI